MINWENVLDENFKLIVDAANKVKQTYLLLPTTYEPKGIVRERVFCYEFYHQLRSLQGDECLLVINGEIDKRGHPGFKLENRKNPDFVFHCPGSMDKNTIIMEVKGKLSDIDEIAEDFEKLLNWLHYGEYEFGVFLLYNHSLNEFIEVFGNKMGKYNVEFDKGRIFILTLPEAHKVEQLISLAQLLNDDNYFENET